jgi:FHS family L-fucose permease-like MFS transporter
MERISNKSKLIDKRYLLPFVLVTSLFALWGFANDITNPMVAAFQTLMELPASEAALVQFAFYGGYATMAVPAALFIRRYSYKRGILIGLALYAIGAFLFIPAAAQQSFAFFCVSLYILTFGLAFLETTVNPLILSLGSKETATRRLNLAQAFNPLGSLLGMSVASLLVLPELLSDKRGLNGEVIYNTLPVAEKALIREHDLAVIRDPYVALGIVVLIIFIVFLCVIVPNLQGQKNIRINNMDTLKNLWKNKRYRLGVVAQMFYVAAQIMVWTFIIQYADNLGINKAMAQNYNICAMLLFLFGRFATTVLMRYLKSGTLLALFGGCAILVTSGAIVIEGMVGLYCLIAISFFMSLMFPTIYGIALENVKREDMSLGAAFLVMAIVGGALMPPLQGMIIDAETIFGMPAVNVSYVLPLICFVIVTIYALGCRKAQEKE